MVLLVAIRQVYPEEKQIGPGGLLGSLVWGLVTGSFVLAEVRGHIRPSHVQSSRELFLSGLS